MNRYNGKQGLSSCGKQVLWADAEKERARKSQSEATARCLLLLDGLSRDSKTMSIDGSREIQDGRSQTNEDDLSMCRSQGRGGRRERSSRTLGAAVEDVRSRWQCVPSFELVGKRSSRQQANTALST